MGNCCGVDQMIFPGQNRYHLKQIRKILSHKVSLQQIYILHLMFKDLAARIVDRKINLENFLLFFHKNGFWGQRLFKEFDFDETNLISQEEFIHGIAKIFKSPETEKINLLFKFFSKNGKSQQGVFFNQFLTMLYNYPKEDLKQVLSDQQFIEMQINKSIVPIEGLRCEESRQNSKKSESLAKVLVGLQNNQKSKPGLYELNENDAASFSMIGKDIMKNLKEKSKNRDTVIRLRGGEVLYDIKTMNIQQLVKKFALRIFDQAKIDVREGKLDFQQFHDWITRHKALYENYYDGFHNQVWQIDPLTKCPKYLKSPCDKLSQAREQADDMLIKVTIRLFHPILVVTQERRQQRPLQVICLQGLAVKHIFDDKDGFGIEITHRDGVYVPKKFFFKDEQLLQQWMELLKYYKGESVQQKYEIGEKIGTGKFSIVYRCCHNYERKEYAIKVIETFKLEVQARRLIAHESSIMQVLSHPLLLKFKECIQTKTHIYIITELVVGKDLFEFVKEYEYLDEKDAAIIAQQILLGIRFLHSFQIIHRDLKPQNIMVVFDEKLQQVCNIKIIDFGFSNYLSKLSQMSSEQLLAGTPNYIAPEILKEQSVTFKIDNFAIGVIIYFMLNGSLPFNDYTITDILKNTMEGIYTYSDSRLISPQAKDLIDQLLKNNPDERISIQDALKHKWFDVLKEKQGVKQKRDKKKARKIHRRSFAL